MVLLSKWVIVPCLLNKFTHFPLGWAVKYALPFLWKLLAVITGQWLRPMRKKECPKCKEDNCPGCYCCCNCNENKCAANTCCNRRCGCVVFMWLLMFSLTSFLIVVNVFPIGIFLYNWINCTVEGSAYHNICYTLHFTDKPDSHTDDILIVLKDTNEQCKLADKYCMIIHVYTHTHIYTIYILFSQIGSLTMRNHKLSFKSTKIWLKCSFSLQLVEVHFLTFSSLWLCFASG